MTFDLALLAALAVFGVLGYRSGAIRQLAHWGGLAAAWLLTSPASGRLTPIVSPHIGISAAITRVLLAPFLFALFGGLGAWLIHSVLTKAAHGRENGPFDDAVGGVFGLAKGAAILFLLLSGAAFFEPHLVKFFGKPPAAVDQSLAVNFVRRHGLFETASLPSLAKLEKLVGAVRDPKSETSLAKDPQFQALLKDPALRKTLSEDATARALLSGDVSALKKDPRLAALLKDPRLAEPAP